MKAKEAFEAQEILKEFRKGLDSLSESKLIGALDLAIEALKVQDMTLYMNLPEVSAEEAVEILKRNNRIELIPSGEDTNVPNTDTISRQATITEIKNYERDSTAPIDYVKIVEQMPPAQQEPKSPLYYGDGYSEGKMVYDSAECPNCGYIYDEGDHVWGEPYCPHCGQALDWYMRGEQDE